MAILPAAAALDPGFALVRGADQWVRASFADCALVAGAVQLAWEDVPEGGQVPGAAPPRGAARGRAACPGAKSPKVCATAAKSGVGAGPGWAGRSASWAAQGRRSTLPASGRLW